MRLLGEEREKVALTLANGALAKMYYPAYNPAYTKLESVRVY